MRLPFLLNILFHMNPHHKELPPYVMKLNLPEGFINLETVYVDENTDSYVVENQDITI
jgi:hypothetical protein